MRLELLSVIAVCFLCSCSATPGPDKTAAGAVLGAGWGLGSGAIVGNQFDASGQGMAIGAGLGAGAGLATGIGLDIAEGEELEQQRQLDSLKVQAAANQRALYSLQDTLDIRNAKLATTAAPPRIYFDEGEASLRLGAAEELERLAQTLKNNPYIGHIEIHGHSDDTGNSDQNARLSEARARTVATFLANQGISLDQMRLLAHSAQQPIASNESEAGRQLNRRVEIGFLK